MTAVHVYTRAHQPATRFVVSVGYPQEQRHIMRSKPRAHVWTSCCRRRREARYCTVQVYYDSVPFWCRRGHGCKKVRE